jgi:4-methyl-5(b-hydroxyethyl)-thiazole monophosphate biosynthesis
MLTALIPLAEGFEEIEAVTIIDVLRRANIEVTVAALDNELVKGSHHIPLLADCLLTEVLDNTYDLIALHGGPGTQHLKASSQVLQLLKEQSAQGKLIGAICAAPTVLSTAGLLKERRATAYPTVKAELQVKEYLEVDVVADGNIITGRSPAAALPFALKLVELLAGTETAKQTAQAMIYTV